MVARKDPSVIVSSIVLQQVMNFTLSFLHFKCENHLNYIFFYASYCLEQVRCLVAFRESVRKQAEGKGLSKGPKKL